MLEEKNDRSAAQKSKERQASRVNQEEEEGRSSRREKRAKRRPAEWVTPNAGLQLLVLDFAELVGRVGSNSKMPLKELTL